MSRPALASAVIDSIRDYRPLAERARAQRETLLKTLETMTTTDPNVALVQGQLRQLKDTLDLENKLKAEANSS